MLAFACLVGPGRIARAAAEPSDLLKQVQAADVLSDLITWSADRAAARSDSMRQYLTATGRVDAFRDSLSAPRPPTTGPTTQPLFYDQMFLGTVRFVEQGGDRYADPALKKLAGKQLMQELSALATYNIGEFKTLNQQRAVIGVMKAYLQSTGQLEAYAKWATVHTPDLASAPSTAGAQPQSSAAMVAKTEAMMQAAKDAARKRAEAQGVSPGDFEQQWNQKQAKLHDDISHRLEGMSDLAQAFSKMASAKPMPLNRSASSAVSSRQPADEYPFGDPFNTTYQGPGVYESNDRRVDIGEDQRVNGEFDRRANLGFDRRLTVNVNPRKGI